MARLIAPNDTMRETVVKGAQTGRETAYGRIADVTNPAHIRALKDAGFTPAGIGGGGARGGFECQTCGFHSWFRKCSRCQGEGVRL